MAASIIDSANFQGIFSTTAMRRNIDLTHLDRAALARMCDPQNYLGQSGVMVDRVLERMAG